MGKPKNLTHITVEQINRGEKYHVTLDEKAQISTVEGANLKINDVYSTVESNSAIWGNEISGCTCSGEISLLSSSIDDNTNDINDVTSTVESNSATWSLTANYDSEIASLSSNIDNNSDNISIVSGDLIDNNNLTNDVYSTVESNSATWSLTANYDSEIASLSSSIDNNTVDINGVTSTVESNSGSWSGGGGGGTTGYDVVIEPEDDFATMKAKIEDINNKYILVMPASTELPLFGFRVFESLLTINDDKIIVGHPEASFDFTSSIVQQLAIGDNVIINNMTMKQPCPSDNNPDKGLIEMGENSKIVNCQIINPVIKIGTYNRYIVKGGSLVNCYVEADEHMSGAYQTKLIDTKIKYLTTGLPQTVAKDCPIISNVEIENGANMGLDGCKYIDNLKINNCGTALNNCQYINNTEITNATTHLNECSFIDTGTINCDWSKVSNCSFDWVVPGNGHKGTFSAEKLDNNFIYDLPLYNGRLANDTVKEYRNYSNYNVRCYLEYFMINDVLVFDNDDPVNEAILVLQDEQYYPMPNGSFIYVIQKGSEPVYIKAHNADSVYLNDVEHGTAQTTGQWTHIRVEKVGYNSWYATT